MFLVFGEFANKYSAIPNLCLVNEPDLTKILKTEIFVHTDEQLRAAYLILSYNPLSRGVRRSSWVELRGFFDTTHHGGSKTIQPNPTYGLDNYFYYYYY